MAIDRYDKVYTLIHYPVTGVHFLTRCGLRNYEYTVVTLRKDRVTCYDCRKNLYCMRQDDIPVYVESE